MTAEPARKPSGKHPNNEKLFIPSKVPKSPGVYILKAAGERVLYVGKARSLRNRLSTYFHRSANLDQRKSAMMAKVRGYSVIVTSNELEALALEANLIKQYKPKFNILLRDDKNYPYLRIDINEQWPTLGVVRRISKDGAMYFGPYVPAGVMWEALEFIKNNFRLRPCKYRLDRPMRPCVQYQMKRCPAPCAGLIDREKYMKSVEDVILFLKGKNTALLDSLQKEMDKLSSEMRYEEAAVIRDRIASLRRALESQKVVSPELGDADVIGVALGERDACVQALFIRGGVMIGAKDFILRDSADVPVPEMLRSFMVMFYSGDVLPPKNILMPQRPEDAVSMAQWLSSRAGVAVKFDAPKRGKRAGLVKMALDNAKEALQRRRATGIGPVMLELSGRLGFGADIESIGAFDVSTLAGGESVGAFILWRDGEFDKNSYRHLRMRGVIGVDDYAMMAQTVRRVLDDIKPMPDVIVIDGGRGHLDAAIKAAREVSSAPAFMVSVAKKPDRLFLPDKDDPVPIMDKQPSSLLLRKIRDEVHRFAVGYHTKLRDKRLMHSPLEDVKGISKKRRTALLKQFGSLEAIRKATVDELAAVKGMTKPVAEALKTALMGPGGGDG